MCIPLSAEHLVMADKFWKDYRLDKPLKLKYALTQDDYGAFKLALEKALDKHEELQQDDIAKVRKDHYNL